MLGCQDFCGYYDWTFAYVRRRFGAQAVKDLWADAIGGESQAHYLKAALEDGLRGLLHTWDKTGGEEHCDWTFTLDESRNVLRWDMRACPSKGFLLEHNLNADEDYCDHCMGWIIPLLDKAGVEVAAHEHNHCGQCWAEMRIRGKPYQTLAGGERDIRADPRWQRGYVDRWTAGSKVAGAGGNDADPAKAICDHFAGAISIAVVASGAADQEFRAGSAPADRIITTSSIYIRGDRSDRGDAFPDVPSAVVIEDAPPDADLHAISKHFNATPAPRRPLLLYGYLPPLDPSDRFPAFARHDLPRPLPLLPLLIRTGLYRHDPGAPRPSAGELASLLARAVRAGGSTE